MRYINATLLAAAAVLLTGLSAQPAHADVSFDFAYSNLSQHGSWLVSAEYGRVWQPREYNREWNPYYDGHWVDTDMGWAWVSDYEWGSIPYHYGTWVLDSRAGWVWIPGDVWAPSWVVFRTSPGYIGWAPVPPGYSVGVSIQFGAPSSFIYVSSGNFLAPRLRGSIIPRDRERTFINNTTVVNNIVIQNNVVINRGPDVRTIERATGRTVHRERIEQVTRVAPFEHVSRSQLAVAPERAKHGLRAAEPVPESRPLPTADNRGGRNEKSQQRAPVAAPAHEKAPTGHEAQAHRQDAAPVKPSNKAEQRQPGPSKAQSDAKSHPQNAQPSAAPAHDAAPAPRHEAAPATPSNKAEQGNPGPARLGATRSPTRRPGRNRRHPRPQRRPKRRRRRAARRRPRPRRPRRPRTTRKTRRTRRATPRRRIRAPTRAPLRIPRTERNSS